MVPDINVAQTSFGFARPKRKRREGGGKKPLPGNVGLLPHRKRPAFLRRIPAQITMRAVSGIPSLRVQLLLQWVRREIVRASAKGFRVIHWSIQTNHLHLIVEADDGVALSRGVQRLASRIAMVVNGVVGRRGQFWRERYHRRDLPDGRQFRNSMVYVLFNSRKHATEAERAVRARGLERWESSVLWVESWNASAELVARIRAAREGPPPVARPESFIAKYLWHRYGKLRPDEMPCIGGGHQPNRLRP